MPQIENHYLFIEEVVKKYNYTVYDIDFNKLVNPQILSVFIESETNVKFDDIVLITNIINKRFDEFDSLNEQFILEVSTPGLTRTLHKPVHFSKSINSLITFDYLNSEVEGIIIKVVDNIVTIAIDSVDKDHNISEITNAKLQYVAITKEITTQENDYE